MKGRRLELTQVAELRVNVESMMVTDEPSTRIAPPLPPCVFTARTSDREREQEVGERALEKKPCAEMYSPGQSHLSESA